MGSAGHHAADLQGGRKSAERDGSMGPTDKRQRGPNDDQSRHAADQNHKHALAQRTLSRRVGSYVLWRAALAIVRRRANIVVFNL